MLSNTPDIREFKGVYQEYRKVLLSSMEFIVDRFERNSRYSWIDTKINIITGKDFSQDDSLGGMDIVYSWIQGRGLESLALHCKWILNNCSDKKSLILTSKLETVIEGVAKSIESAKILNGGHLFFFMDPQGNALKLQGNGCWIKHRLNSSDLWNTSDIFASRGLFAASLITGNKESRESATEYIWDIFDGIKKGKFATDQQSLAPGNPVDAVPGRLSQSPWMLLIGTMTLLLKNGVPETLETGIWIIRYIMDNHVNFNGKWSNLEEYDYIEYIGSDRELWISDGRVLSDPGHALEFVGLVLRFISAARSVSSSDEYLEKNLNEISSLMFPVFYRNFMNGFNRRSGGIIKLLNLIDRNPVNSHMPWWSLPETMRASLGCYDVVKGNSEREFCMEAYSLCHNSFFTNYIMESSPGMLAVQTRDSRGNVIDSIPAVPDADPGYHTGLCLIDCLEMIESIVE